MVLPKKTPFGAARALTGTKNSPYLDYFIVFLENRDQKLSQNTYELVKPYLSKEDRILDVGSGTGAVARLIKKNIGSQIECLDVMDLGGPDFKPVIFNGRNFPFADNTFSKVLCCFVLHHTIFQDELLQEMKRVARSRILILEDTPRHFIDWFLVFGHRIASRFIYQSIKMKFYSDQQWQAIFQKKGLILERVVDIKKRDKLYPVHRKLYVLKKPC